jgi:transposase-like protein
MEVTVMQAKRKSADEQYELIMECRNSGLSDYQWCQEHDINPGTFYNWVKRLRRKACYDIPPATGRGSYKAFADDSILHRRNIQEICKDGKIPESRIVFC